MVLSSYRRATSGRTSSYTDQVTFPSPGVVAASTGAAINVAYPGCVAQDVLCPIFDSVPAFFVITNLWCGTDTLLGWIHNMDPAVARDPGNLTVRFRIFKHV